MSEPNEIVVDKPPAEKPEPAGEEKLSNASIDVSKKELDVSMLDDEEMPTYSSISSSNKPNNSTTSYDQKVNDVPVENKTRTPSPDPSEDHDNEDNESIYVVSSTADTDRNPDDIDDEEEEDSEEMNEDEEEDDEEEDEDDDGRDEYDTEPFDRESDDFDEERLERASDDFVLRHNDSIKKYYKERSLSLQDLTTMESRYNKRSHYPRFRYYADAPLFKPNVYSPYALNSKPYQGSGRYEHIESKVKRYIQNIKEQEQLTKVRNPARIKDFKENKSKPVVGGKHIKEYAEKVIKELEDEDEDEICEDPLSSYATLERMENGEDIEPLKLSERMSSDVDIHMEVDDSPPLKHMNDNKYEKVNGIIEFGEESEVTCTPILKEVSVHRVNEQINGTESTKNLINLRTLSYEEYMQGDTEEDVEVEIEPTEICLISPEKIPPAKQNNVDAPNPIRISSVKSNFQDSEDEESYRRRDKKSFKTINEETETIKAENEIRILQDSLNQRNSQFEVLQVAFQKTLSENLAMKQELENLKKALKKYEEHENRERKSISVQTESVEIMDSQSNNLTEGKDKLKMSVTSLTSAISSIHPWSESGASPSISVSSPDIRKAVNSENSSVFEKTPKPPPRALSRAFVTSSRILQTLSNITQKKWNASSPIPQDQRNEENQDEGIVEEDPSTSGTSLNSKKRKATEMLGIPGFEQPFKIPHTSGSGRKKISKDSGHETAQMNGLPCQSENSADDAKDGEDQGDNMKKDLDDNLKYYVYQDEENSKERSFLIQTEETGKVSNKGVVRECGPYILGNLEVRMTEVNGTINIWGKEINVESTEEEFDLSKAGLLLQKTPISNLLNNSYTSSTVKKPRTQSRLNDSNISKISNSSEYGTPKYSPQMNKQSCHRNSLTSDDNCISHTRRLSWSGCKHLMEEQKHVNHSQHDDLDCERFGCTRNAKRCECHSCNRNQQHADNYRRHSFSGGSNRTSMGNDCLNHSSHCLKTGNEGHFRHHSNHCQSSYDEEENCQHYSKRCHLSREFTHSCSPKNVSMNHECSDNFASGCCQSRSFTNPKDESPQQRFEPPEIRKKRLSGKKVRTLLMDLLTGCGDCRTPDPANMSKANIVGREPTQVSGRMPQIIVTPCTPRASYSNQSQSMEKNRCCDTCSRRIEMTAEIEAQLEFFRIEMERLRSRSDALLDKFNMLKSTDLN